MKCLKCGTENAPIKKCCSNCGAILEGFTVNNVTGEYGYRDSDGRFYKLETDEDAIQKMEQHKKNIEVCKEQMSAEADAVKKQIASLISGFEAKWQVLVCPEIVSEYESTIDDAGLHCTITRVVHLWRDASHTIEY